MTVNYARFARSAWRGGFALLALVPAAAALAAQSKSSAAPRAVVVQPTPAARFQQSVRQQQTSSQLRQNQVEEQLRQQRAANTRQPYANDSTVSGQLDQADRAHQNAYQSRQQDTVNRYNSAAALPVPAPTVRELHARPASSGSGK
jgi:flagellar biosynthesis GTPase FlhF